MIERRAIVRQKSFMLGRVLFNRRQSSMDCLIRDFTKIGARLHFPEMGSLPDTFELYVPSKDEYFQAHAIWHKGSDVGVAWTPEKSTATPPGGGYQSADPIGDRLAKVEHDVALLHKRLDALQA
jgi:hypothetical protein